jgi:cell division protein FtsB
MSDIDVVQDLEQVSKQLEELVGQLNALNTQREQLTQQVHNLNGIAMYLRGKQEEQPASTNGVVEELELTEEFPPEGV